ncbi:MAG: translation initiation factor IF-3 [Pseudomonadota bacterium]
MPAPPARSGPRVNQDIDAPQVRLINGQGDMVGVVSIAQALETATQEGLDLVEVSPSAEPPVCKVLDYGKYKYTIQKKRNETRRKQKVTDIKELKLRPTIDTHDFNVKLRKARAFLESGDKLKATLRFRGREFAHQELGMEVLTRLREQCADLAKIEVEPKMEGRQAVMILSPRS